MLASWSVASYIFFWIFCDISVSKTVVFYDVKTAILEESKYFSIVFMMSLGYEKMMEKLQWKSIEIVSSCPYNVS